jgi:hypothetical protein
MLVVRLLISALASAVAGGYLGVLAEYGAYWYAYHYGIRPPLEGIPYIGLAVAGLTFAVLVGAALAFAVIYVSAEILLLVIHLQLKQGERTLTFVKRFVPDSLRESLEEAETLVDFHNVIRSLSLGRIVLLALVLGAFVGGVVAVVLWRASEFNLIPALIAGLLTGVIILLEWNRLVGVWLAIAAVGALLIVGPLLVFNVEWYGAALRELGYGGGVPVTVVLAPSDNEANEQRPAESKDRASRKIRGALMLRTTEALILFDTTERIIREVPLDRVQHIDQALPSWYLQAIEKLMSSQESIPPPRTQ